MSGKSPPRQLHYPLCTFIFYGFTFAQSNDLQVLAAGGGYEVKPQLSISYTIGEISISTQSNASLIKTQGFQQSFLLLLPLPVELLDFTAKKTGKTVELSWQTASERNNAGFEIERSADSEDWETIGFVARQGNSNGLQQYAFPDKLPCPKTIITASNKSAWTGNMNTQQ